MTKLIALDILKFFMKPQNYLVHNTYSSFLWGKQSSKIKLEKILKGRMGSIPSLSPSVKIQIMGGKVFWGVKAKHCWGLSTNFWKQKVNKRFVFT